ncbi:VOC family protein [Tessaracoccus sp. OH4464_COT-324]|uniref:VOC family protein n=1 Tax=Tessaracoccus sp. OH4464_COT-324 TaxID=2491059 RepID=UPI000F63D14B|nr:VOC family protein [Tessaracoccus sp. OH4464_COT-324]RRD45847.1 VOC family protein [Tessaracoccus sp. OH4464_COT-324]
MHIDHLIFAAGPDGLKADAARLAEALGADFKDGGFHPRFGTRNHIIPLADSRYIEVVEVLDHPAAEKAPFGQAVRARSNMGGGWMAWVVSVDDIAPIEERLERQAVQGARNFPDGRRLEWQQIGIRGLIADPQLPYFVHWLSSADVRPSALTGEVRIKALDISGSAERLSQWLDLPIASELDGIELRLVAPNGTPGINRVVFESPSKGEVIL